MPPNSSEIVPSRTTTLFLSEKSMMPLSMVVTASPSAGAANFLPRPGRGLLWAFPRGPWRTSGKRRVYQKPHLRARSLHFLDRLAQLAFRLEHALAGSNHPLALFQPAENFVQIAFRSGSECHGAGIKTSFVQRDENRVLLAAAQHGHVRNQQSRWRKLRRHLNRCVHAGFEEVTGIMEFHPHPRGAGLFVHRWINVSHPAAEFWI